MADIKLAQLPDRTPVKLALVLTPELHRDLVEYALSYAQAYGREEPVAELVPAMLESFLLSDRGFARSRRAKAR